MAELEAKFNILEDDPKLADHYVDHTKVEDIMEVDKFTNKEDLINAVIDRRAINIFWVDINLGIGEEESGLDAIKFIRPRYPNALIIVVTAYADLKERCMAAGANHFFEKGSHMREKIKAIKKIIHEFLDENGLSVNILEFHGLIANVDSRWVKIECYKDGKTTDKRFPFKMMKTALKGGLKLEARVKIKAIQKNSSITVDISLDPDQPNDELDLSKVNLLDSAIWTNKL